MKKLIKLTSVLTVFALLAFAFAGCAPKDGSSAAEVSLNDFPYGTAEIKELAATIDNYAAAPAAQFEPAVVTEGAGVFSDKTVFAKGDGSSDDTDAIKEGLAQAASSGYFLITRPVFIGESILLPDGMTLAFTGGGRIILAAGATLYLGNNCKIAAGRQRIFDGSGKVAGGDYDLYALPEWFGASIGSGADASPAIEAAAAIASTVYLDAGTYNLSAVVSLPVDHDVTVAGSGLKSTFLITHGQKIFERVSADTCVTVRDLRADEIGHGRSATLIKVTGGEFTLTGCYLYGYANVMDLNSCERVSVSMGYANDNLTVFRLNGCENVEMRSFLGLTNQHLIVASDCENIVLNTASEVWGFGTDVEFTDCTGITVSLGGFDLGYTALSGSSKPYGENPAAIKMTDCEGVVIRDMWVATNGGVSYTANATVGVPADRVGIDLDGCTDVAIEFCTITNHSKGLRISNAPASSKRITVTGNQFVGNEDYNAVLQNSSAITFMVNCFTQDMTSSTAADITGNGCSDVLFAGDTFRKQTSISSLQNSFTNSTNIVFDSPIFF